MRKQLFIGALTMALAATGFAQQNTMPDRPVPQQQNSLLPACNRIGQINAMFPNQGYPAPAGQQGALKPTEMQSRWKTGIMGVYNGSDYTTMDSIELYWAENKSQPGIDTIILMQIGVPFPSATLYDPNLFTQGTKNDSSFSQDYTGKMTKQYMTYDANGNTLTVLNVVDTGAGWENSAYYQYTYDDQSHFTSEQGQYWTGAEWANSYFYLYEYNAAGKNTGRINLSGSGSDWDSVMRWEYYYDVNNNFTGQLTDVWNTDNSSWETFSQFIETLDDDGLRIAEERQEWDGTQWISDFKDEYTYDGNDRLASATHSVWNGTAWDLTTRYYYAYDADGHFTEQIYQGWDGSAWIDSTKQENVYEGGLLNEVNYSVWSAADSAFQYAFQYAYAYNNYNQCTMLKSANWDGSAFTPVPDNDAKYTFIYEEFDDSGINSLLADEDFKLYPNPAQDLITVQINKNRINHIRVVDMSGRVVFQTKGKMNASAITFPTNQLTDGIYILQVQSGNQAGSKIFVVKH